MLRIQGFSRRIWSSRLVRFLGEDASIMASTGAKIIEWWPQLAPPTRSIQMLAVDLPDNWSKSECFHLELKMHHTMVSLYLWLDFWSLPSSLSPFWRGRIPVVPADTPPQVFSPYICIRSTPPGPELSSQMLFSGKLHFWTMTPECEALWELSPQIAKGRNWRGGLTIYSSLHWSSPSFSVW